MNLKRCSLAARCFAAALLGMAALPGLRAELSNWRIDPPHSSAQFAVRHMMVSTVRGHFGSMKGTIQFDPADFSKAVAEVTVAVTSIDTREPKRDAHLKSPDFFDAEKFPTLTFKSKSVQAAGSGKLKMTGDLTIHGVTKEVAFDVEGPTPAIKDQMGNLRVGAAATAKVNRKDFGLVWNRALDGGGAVVGDDVQITLDVELVQMKASP